jgi:hypothetical protein
MAFAWLVHAAVGGVIVPEHDGVGQLPLRHTCVQPRVSGPTMLVLAMNVVPWTAPFSHSAHDLKSEQYCGHELSTPTQRWTSV